MQSMNLGLMGYGEVGGIFCAGLKDQAASVQAWDIKLAADGAGAPLRARAEHDGVPLCGSAAELCSRSDLIMSAVTASSTVDVAREAARHIRPGTVFLDLNSASPGAKRMAASKVEQAGARYVEGAVMTSVPPYRIRVPLLLGGQHAAALAPLLAVLGFDAKAGPQELGIASATKMCRSVMIKGLEAMVIESFTAARAWGVEDEVLASLAETFPGIDWEKQASYFFERVILHGRRRAEEMRESANTVREAGLEPWSAAGTANRQAWVADLADEGIFGRPPDARADWRVQADRILAARDEQR